MTKKFLLLLIVGVRRSVEAGRPRVQRDLGEFGLGAVDQNRDFVEPGNIELLGVGGLAV